MGSSGIHWILTTSASLISASNHFQNNEGAIAAACQLFQIHLSVSPKTVRIRFRDQ
jgi:hypothetical protein